MKFLALTARTFWKAFIQKFGELFIQQFLPHVNAYVYFHLSNGPLVCLANNILYSVKTGKLKTPRLIYGIPEMIAVLNMIAKFKVDWKRF